jgi:hypothetical protein
MQRLDPAPSGFLLEVLELEEVQVRRRMAAAKACSAYRGATHSDLTAATLGVVTASCCTLIDTIGSQEGWSIAAERYALLTHPYAEVLSVCAGSPNAIRASRSLHSPAALQCRLIQLGWLLITDFQNAQSYRQELVSLRELADRMAALAPGQLAIPVLYTYELTHALANELPWNRINSTVSSAIRELLRRGSERVRSAQADKYHWQRILPGFMPVEPEWLAVGRIGYEAANSARADVSLITDTAAVVRDREVLGSGQTG